MRYSNTICDRINKKITGTDRCQTTKSTNQSGCHVPGCTPLLFSLDEPRPGHQLLAFH